MKTLLFSLIAVMTFGLLAPQAEADSGRHRYRDGGRSYSHSHSRSHVYYGGSSYRTRSRTYYDDCYRPSYSYYRPARVVRYYDDCYVPSVRYYSRPRFSFSFGF